jgi:hypothetical protein
LRRGIFKLLQVPTEKEDPPIIFNTMYLDRKRDSNPPFYLSVGMNGLRLNNCMLYFGTSTNAMSLKAMEKIVLNTTQTYGNVCGIDSNRLMVYGICDNVEVFLIDFPHISLLMNIVVIDVSDTCGMILSGILPMHTFPWGMEPLRYYIVKSGLTNM